ncbi:MAG: hypothetical protein HY646_02985, partial [Acidobacteria bacterium]|nr:hypothetical protein [Acidobacteriota bacterium]
MLRVAAASVVTMLFAASFAGAQVTSSPENWREDLGIIRNTLPSVHANLYFQTSQNSFQSAGATLDAEIPQLSDRQIIVRMAELIAMVGDAHTSLSLSANPTNFRIYPIRVQWFDDGLFVIASLPGSQRAIGKKVVSIDGRGIDDVYARIGQTISAENDPWRRRISQDYLVIPEVLNAIGVASSTDTAEFVLQDSSGSTSAFQFTAVPPAEPRRWIYIPDLTSEAIPLYRKQNNQNYWFQYLSESRTFYFKYNSCTNSPFLSFNDFASQFLAAVDAHRVDRFIFDLRNNTGGNSALITPLLTGLEQRYASGALATARLFVIIGRETFSSGLLNALTLKSAPFAVLVGEPTGGKPNHYGQVTSITLPRSGLRVSYSTQFFSSSETTPSLNPDVGVPFTSAAFFANRDPYLEAALEGLSPVTDVSPFVMYNGGGSRMQSAGVGESIRAGYATVAAPSAPFAFEIVRYRERGATISEATVTPSAPVSSGSIYAEVEGRVNTGVALANTSDLEARVSFQINRANGELAGSGEINLPARSQLARFLSLPPFNMQSLAGGALTFTSNVPISVLGLRGFTNERNEFLLSTVSVTNSAVAGTVYCAHFANGDGWTTQINLLNPTGDSLSGTVEFVPGDRLAFTLPPRSAQRIRTSGAGPLTTGFVRIIPDSGSLSPAATSLFSYRRNGVTVTEASVHGTAATAAQQMIVSASGGFSVRTPNALMSGLAIANPGSSPAALQLTITSLAGNALGTASLELNPNTQR